VRVRTRESFAVEGRFPGSGQTDQNHTFDLH
jgi:hypothetical protein